MANTRTPTTTPASVTVAGQEVHLPVEVRSATMIGAQYLVDADAARRLVDPTGLRVVRRAGRTVCSVTAVQYADNDLGPYNEIAMALEVLPHDAGPGYRPSVQRMTTYIHRLPVNAAFTCAAGRDIWGFPKWIADISYLTRSATTEAVLLDEGRLVLALTVGRGGVPLPAQTSEMSCYSWRDGVLRRTPWTTTNRLAIARPGGAGLALGVGHPMAEELRSLGLPRRALFSITVGLLQASFGAAEVVTGA
jgi:hypothetical protein